MSIRREGSTTDSCLLQFSCVDKHSDRHSLANVKAFSPATSVYIGRSGIYFAKGLSSFSFSHDYVLREKLFSPALVQILTCPLYSSEAIVTIYKRSTRIGTDTSFLLAFGSTGKVPTTLTLS